MGLSVAKKAQPSGRQAAVNELCMKKKEFDKIRSLIYQQSGISLGRHKITMIQSRLSKRLKKLGLMSYEEYIDYITGPAAKRELTYFVNALTTNKTEFFRENSHFEYLKHVFLKQFLQQNNRPHKPLYIWSAACSTGEEVYTLAMIMEEYAINNPGFFYRILGTDIDTDMLNRSAGGIYKRDNIKNIPLQYLHKYLMRGIGRNKGTYKIADILKEKVKFRQFNLTEEHACLNIRFDIIFLRNVLIYFDKETIEKVIKKVSYHLVSGGLLFIGHSETLHTVRHDLKSIGSAIYIKC